MATNDEADNELWFAGDVQPGSLLALRNLLRNSEQAWQLYENGQEITAFHYSRKGPASAEVFRQENRSLSLRWKRQASEYDGFDRLEGMCLSETSRRLTAEFVDGFIGRLHLASGFPSPKVGDMAVVEAIKLWDALPPEPRKEPLPADEKPKPKRASPGEAKKQMIEAMRQLMREERFEIDRADVKALCPTVNPKTFDRNMKHRDVAKFWNQIKALRQDPESFSVREKRDRRKRKGERPDDP